MAVGLLTQSCLAWFLEPAGRGSYATCILFATLLTIVCVLGCDVAAIYFVASKRLTLSEGITNTLIHGGAGCALAILAGLVMIQLPLRFLEKATPTAFYLALVLLPLSFFAPTFMNLLGAMREFAWMAGLSVLMSTIQLGLVVLLVVLLDLGVNGALMALIVSNALCIVLLMSVYRVKYRASLVRPSRESLGQMLHYGVRYYFGKISNQVNYQIGAIILAFFATREELGLFSVATVLAVSVQMIPDTLTLVLQPRVAADDGGRATLIAQCARVTTLICGLILAALAILATPIVSILFSPAFLPAVPLFRILTIGMLARAATKQFVPFLVGTDRPGAASLSVVIGMAINLLALYLLMPRMGLPGAAWAMTLGYVAGSVMLMASFARNSDVSFWQTWHFRRSDWAVMGRMIQSLRTRLMPVVQAEV